MPLPNPREDETQSKFISRCMGDDIVRGEFPDRQQQAGYCYTAWRKAHGGKARVVVDGREYGQAWCMTPELAAKDIATEQDAGWIEGYSAAFNNVDFYNERILSGAFAKTIQEQLPKGRVKLMLEHIAHGGREKEIVGTATQAKEDEYGLWSHFELGTKSAAQDLRRDVTDGLIGFMSVGYQVMKDAKSEVEGKAIRDLVELKWLESVVTAWPVNEQAIITDAKAIADETESLIEEATALACNSRGTFLDAKRSHITGLLERGKAAQETLRKLIEEPDTLAPVRAVSHSWRVKLMKKRLSLAALSEGVSTPEGKARCESGRRSEDIGRKG